MLQLRQLPISNPLMHCLELLDHLLSFLLLVNFRRLRGIHGRRRLRDARYRAAVRIDDTFVFPDTHGFWKLCIQLQHCCCHT